MRLKLNPDKTEFALFGNQVQLNKCITNKFQAAEDTILRSDYVKCLGVILDRNLNLKLHCKNQVRKAMANFIKIRKYSQISYNEIFGSTFTWSSNITLRLL